MKTMASHTQAELQKNTIKELKGAKVDLLLRLGTSVSLFFWDGHHYQSGVLFLDNFDCNAPEYKPKSDIWILIQIGIARVDSAVVVEGKELVRVAIAEPLILDFLFKFYNNNLTYPPIFTFRQFLMEPFIQHKLTSSENGFRLEVLRTYFVSNYATNDKLRTMFDDIDGNDYELVTTYHYSSDVPELKPLVDLNWVIYPVVCNLTTAQEEIVPRCAEILLKDPSTVEKVTNGQLLQQTHKRLSTWTLPSTNNRDKRDSKVPDGLFKLRK